MRFLPVILGAALVAGLAMLGQLDTTAAPNEHADLRPGSTYVANFPLEQRRKACLDLNYVERSAAFENCVEGNYPENPWFTGYRPLRLALAMGH
jgi:hypothetical protein